MSLDNTKLLDFLDEIDKELEHKNYRGCRRMHCNDTFKRKTNFLIDLAGFCQF